MSLAYQVRIAGIGLLALAIYADDAPPGSADALRRHVEYLASDQLQGRGNGSPGIAAAADYIAAQFKEAGLQPAGTDGYFQTAEVTLLSPNLDGFSLRFSDGKRDIAVAPDEILLLTASGHNLKNVPAVKIDSDDAAAVAALKPEDIAGKVALLKIITKKEGQDRWENMMRVLAKVQEMRPVLVVNYGPNAAKVELPGVFGMPGDSRQEDIPHFPIRTAALRNALETTPSGVTPLRVTLHLAPPIARNVKCRNILGILPGSETGPDARYIVITGNYDGSYMRRGDPDPILHSANANASAIASLIETARMLAGSKPRPRRSILFVALFGEQGAATGLMSGYGAKTYLQHPAVPLAKTDACIKLVQLGRTDANDGPRPGKLAITSHPGSRIIPELLAASGKSAGIEVYEDHARDAVKEGRGFRPALFDSGVPSHALYVAYDFPDAYTAGDIAKKLDYRNMASVQRTIAAGLFALADTQGSLAASGSGNAASPAFEGTWIIESPLVPRPLEGVFRVNGEEVTGTMKLGDGTVVPISAGKIQGDGISFRFQGLNGRTLVAKGLLKAGVIEIELLLPGNEFGSPYTAKKK